MGKCWLVPGCRRLCFLLLKGFCSCGEGCGWCKSRAELCVGCIYEDMACHVTLLMSFAVNRGLGMCLVTLEGWHDARQGYCVWWQSCMGQMLQRACHK